MWTYDSYVELIKLGVAKGTSMFIRHDVDISLKKAVKLAEIETKNNIASTYYILFSSPFYNALDAENLERIRMIKELGHPIGLHFDLSIKEMSDKDACDEILVQLGLLYHHIGVEKPASVTFHKPVMGKDTSEELVRLLNHEGVNCPSYDIQFKYISDSGHNWREDPVEAITLNNLIHINTHPEWYNETAKSMEECLLDLRLDIEGDKKVIKEINDIQEYWKRIK